MVSGAGAVMVPAPFLYVRRFLMRSNKVLPGRVNGQQCGGKVCYINRSVALKAMKSARKQRGDRRYHRERRVYKCPFCHFWHVTSLTLGEKKWFRSQSQDRREAIEDIENTLSGSLPVDEAFEVLERMNEDRLAGREMRGVSSYVDEVEEKEEAMEEAGETEEHEESVGDSANATDSHLQGIREESAHT
jgi:hypothetical protein